MEEGSFKSEGMEKALGSDRTAGLVGCIRTNNYQYARMLRKDFTGLYGGVTDAT